MIVPFPPGGLTDVLGRLIANDLSRSLGQPVVVENKAGAGGNIGMEMTAKAPADGYTIAMVITSHAINMSLNKNSGYDVLKDLAPVRLLVTTTNVLAVHPGVPAKSVRELIDLAKSKKIPLNYSSAGNGTTPHLSGELFKHMAGIEMTHVPYKGAAPGISDLMAGVVQLSFNSVAEQLANIKAGRVRPLAVTSLKRSPLLPDVPTLAQAANLPDYEINGWLGIVAPAATPAPIVDLLSRRISEILQRPDIKERLEGSMAAELADGSPEMFGKFMAAEVEKWRKVVKLANVTVD
jgi:tripartite-type tricarboxylate transporter receptor subunit TctC